MANRNTSKAMLMEDILSQLGHPIIKVNITDKQLEMAIDAAERWCRTWDDDFTYESYYVYTLSDTDITNGYFTVPDYISTVVEIVPHAYDLGTMNFTSPAWQMTRETFLNYNRFVSITLVDYVTVMQRLYNTQAVLGMNVMRFSYNDMTKRVYFQFSAQSGDTVIMKAYEYVDPERTDTATVPVPYYWDNQNLRALAIAYAKQTWGRNLTKYKNIALPGGITMDGQGILDEGLAEEKSMLDYLQGQNSYGRVYMA